MDKHDVFISYAYEQKETIAKPFYTILSSLGISVWFDDTEVKIGNNIRRKLDEGLKKSNFGIILLSKEYISKKYTKYELDSFFVKENDDENIILPVWINLTLEEVKKFSLELAGRKAIKWDGNLFKIIYEIIDVIKPDLKEKINEKIVFLNKIVSGKELSELFVGVHAGYYVNEELNNEEEVQLVSSFMQNIKDYSEIWDEIEIGQKIECQQYIKEIIRNLELNNFAVYANLVDEPYKNIKNCIFHNLIIFVGKSDLKTVCYSNQEVYYFR